MNLKANPTQLAPNQLIGASNIILDEEGGAAKRLGCTNKGTIGAGGDRIISMYTFYRGTVGTVQVLAQTSGGKLYYTTDPTASPIVWTQIATGLSATNRFSFETFNTKCYMSNGVDAYSSWDGTTFTVLPSAPKGRNLRVWKDTMWMSGVTGLDDRVYSSQAGDAETWPIANWVDLGKGDGDVQQALHSDGLTLVAWKRYKTFTVYDPVSFANRVVDFEKGCESHFSAIYIEGSIYFLSRSGICRYLGDAPSEIVSPLIDPIFDPSVLNLNSLNTAWAYTYQNRVGWALPEVGKNFPSMQIEFYPRLAAKPWMVHRMPTTCFTLYRQGIVERLYAGHATANKVLEAFAAVGQDDGVTFQSYLQMRWENFGAENNIKYLKLARVLGRGRFIMQYRTELNVTTQRTFTLDYTAGVDTWNPAETWNTGTWGPSPTTAESPQYPDLYARWFSIVIIDAETGVGARSVNVGATDYATTVGEWALLSLVHEGLLLGVRD